MNESVFFAAIPHNSLLMDQAHVFLYEDRQHSINIVRFQANMMHTRTTFFKILGDTRVLCCGLNQLHLTTAYWKESDGRLFAGYF